MSFDIVDKGVGFVIVAAQTFTCFLISGSSLEILPKDGGCCGHSCSGCHRNMPFNPSALFNKGLSTNSWRGIISRVFFGIHILPLFGTGEAANGLHTIHYKNLKTLLIILDVSQDCG